MLTRFALKTPCWLQFVGPEDAGRTHLEHHIHATYAQVYGANVKEFMPTLVVLQSANGNLLGVMGLRAADHGPLFLEAYLDHPVEQAIALHSGGRVERKQIVELGNLAAGSPGAARLLVMALNAFLQGAGFEWVCFTAVPALKNAFRRLDLGLLELAPADPRRLGPAARDWGSYYEGRPTVVAGNVPYGFGRLDTLMNGEYVQSLLSDLWRQALSMGRRRGGLAA